MTLTEWNALTTEERDAICAERVMGWHKGVPVRGQPAYYSESDWVWYNADRHSMALVRGTAPLSDRLVAFHPTTDRNATAMLVEKVSAMDLAERMIFDAEIRDLPDYKRCGSSRIALLLLDPSLIAYCCVKACEEADDE